MSKPPATSGDVRLSTILGVSLIGLAALSAALYWSTRPSQVVERTARDFLLAVADGDRAEARKYLGDELRLADEARAQTEPWRKQTDTRVVIELVSVREMQATVTAVVQRGGYSIRPSLTLQRIPAGDWRVVRISGLAKDPRWFSDQELQRNEALADDIADALNVPLEGQPPPRPVE